MKNSKFFALTALFVLIVVIFLAIFFVAILPAQWAIAAQNAANPNDFWDVLFTWWLMFSGR